MTGLRPLLGTLSDRFGRRPVILLSNLGLGLDYILMAVAHSLPLLLVGRVISGITSASISTASAYIADVTPPEKRASAFGLIGSAFGVGFVVGPALGGFLGSFDPRRMGIVWSRSTIRIRLVTVFLQECRAAMQAKGAGAPKATKRLA